MNAFDLLDGVSRIDPMTPTTQVPPDAAVDVRDLHMTAPPMDAERVAEGLQVGTAAPDFALPNADGEIVRLSDYRGRPFRR